MNLVERAQRDMLFALVMEASRGHNWEDDLDKLNSKYDLKISSHLLSASLEQWEDERFLAVSRHSDGCSAFIKPSRYGAALSRLMGLLGAEHLEFDWAKEEIYHDAPDDTDWPGLSGWKQFQLARESRPDPSASKATGLGVHVHISPNMTQTVTVPEANKSSAQAAWFGSWGTWVAALVAALAIVVSLRIAGKI